MAGWLARALRVANQGPGQKRSSERRTRRKKLRFEPLEQRRLLAADLASITGVAFNDLDADGLFEPTAGETGISGVEVTLEGATDMGAVSQTLISDSAGGYRFDGLRAGDYTLRQLPPPPAGILPSAAGREVLITITPEQASGTLGATIDSFSGGAQVLTAVAPGAGDPAFQSVVDAGALGGSRDIFVDVTSPTGVTTVSANAAFLPGVLDFNPGSSAAARYVVSWDGDTDPLALSASGLRPSGIDLTAGGAMHGLLVRLGVDKSNEMMTLRVFSDADNFSEATITLPNTGGLATGQVYIPWTDFVAVQGAGGDLSNVGAVQLEIDAGVNAMDGQIDLIAARGPTVITANLSNVPVAAGVDIEKSTNGFDADAGQGPLVAQGGDVVFEYVVRNTGNTPLGAVVVRDDNGTPSNASDDFTPALVDGDANGDGLLDPTETWTLRHAASAALGQYVNIGRVAANPVDENGVDIQGVDDVSDSDPSRHFAVAAGIDVEKSTNGEDADTGTGPIIATGGSVRFEYVVRNTGNVALAAVNLVDDNGTPTVGDDFAPTFLSGDADGDGRLDVGEVWIYEANATAASGAYVNIGRVSANPVTADGDDIAVLEDVQDDDPSRHFALAASIDIEKATEGQDADLPQGPFLPVGAEAEFTYVVTNTGEVALADVHVTDSKMGAVSFVGGDVDNDDVLDVGEVWTYTLTAPVQPGLHVCSGVVTANPILENGSPIPTAPAVTDTDPSHHYGYESIIHLEKTTNGEDADSPTGPSIPFGESVTFQYVVTNPGNQPLQNVTLWDDAGTPGDASDDVQPTFIGGDDNNDGLLDPEEAWLYEWLSTAIAGQYENRAVAAADDFFAQSVSDDDLSHYLGLKPINPTAIPPNVPNKRRFLSSTW